MQNLSDKLIYDRVTIASAVSGTNNIRRNKVKPGKTEEIRIVSVENKTNKYTSLRIGIFDNGVYYPYFEEKYPVAAELFYTTDIIILREGQQLQAELNGCTLGDKIEMFIHGEWSEEI